MHYTQSTDTVKSQCILLLKPEDNDECVF